ncbi:(d)CMP kinase [Candidatus Babeliales bacterium]|nr:(d)CMP kinase [Candidatus Babeliales bacterium]
MIITIDGPAASGKSSVAQALASRLGCYYLYTGLLYRAFAYLLKNKYGVQISQIVTCIGPCVVQEDDLTMIESIDYSYDDGKPQITIDGRKVTEELYQSDIDQLASIISANKMVRERLLPLQRRVGKKYDIVADGRDCGSVVFPDADYKFYLTASLDVRAKRLVSDAKRKNGDMNVEKIREELEVRDQRDTQREVAPLRVPEGATVIDNSALTKDDTLQEFLHYINDL